MFVTKFIVVGLLLGFVHGQNTELEGGLINSLPPDLQGKIDEKQVEEIKNTATEQIKEKCLKNGGPGAYEKAENASKVLMECVQGLVDKDQLVKEIEDAKPHGMVDEVFKKYCTKTPQFKACLHEMGDSAKACMSLEESKHLTTFYNITDQLAEFVCFKDGDRIALFIAEGGPDCIKEKQEEIAQCANQTFASSGYKFDQNNISIDSLPTIAFSKQDCSKFTELQTCVVGVLEKCSQPTTANIVESLFKFVRKSTPCWEGNTVPVPAAKTNTKEDKPASASSISVATFLLTTTTVLVTMFNI